MSADNFELPFRQLLWQVFKLRQAEKINQEYRYNNNQNVKYWRDKIDETLKTIGVDEATDFKNVQIGFYKKATS